MSDPSCVHQWQVAKSHSGNRMRVCQVCGRAEQDPAWKLLFKEDKPEVPGWYWYRNNRKEAEPVVVYVHPQLDTIGVRDGRASTAAQPSTGQMGRSLRDAGKISGGGDRRRDEATRMSNLRT